jgi:integrase/recombinase XerC
MTTTPTESLAGRQAALDAARLVLAGMGLSAQDLLTEPDTRPPAPTFAEYIPIVSNAVSKGTRRVYGSYWNRIEQHWGERRLDEPTPSDVRTMVEHVRANVVPRRNSRGGRSAAEHLIAALRCLYKHAADDDLINQDHNPARKVDKPRRLPSTRRAVADTHLAEINTTAATTGNDPALDALLLRLHTETACRRAGALALRPQDLDPDQCLIFLREKGETVRWQPVSPTLMTHLQHHAEQRHAPRDGQLLRYTNGKPITRRRYDHLWNRIGQHLPWVATQQISTHWLRATPPSPGSNATSATPPPAPSQATPTAAPSPAPRQPTYAPPCTKSPPPSPRSPANPTHSPTRTAAATMPNTADHGQNSTLATTPALCPQETHVTPDAEVDTTPALDSRNLDVGQSIRDQPSTSTPAAAREFLAELDRLKAARRAALQAHRAAWQARYRAQEEARRRLATRYGSDLEKRWAVDPNAPQVDAVSLLQAFSCIKQAPP